MTVKSSPPPPHAITHFERAVYTLAQHGILVVAHAAEYRKEIDALERTGFIRADHTGKYRVIADLPAPKPRPEPTKQVVARWPESLVTRADKRAGALGTNRSDLIRNALVAYLDKESERAPAPSPKAPAGDGATEAPPSGRSGTRRATRPSSFPPAMSASTGTRKRRT